MARLLWKSKKNKRQKSIMVAVSGGFDPVHIGHIRLFKEAKKLGDKLIIILNTDKFLKKKKGYVFMPYRERKEIIENIKYVDKVVRCIDRDQTVCKTLESLKPHIFANGGDRKPGNVPEVKICKTIGCKMVYNVGKGGKVQSSSWFLQKFLSYFKNK